MIKLTIATGKSRTDVKWKNQEVTWGGLKDRLKETKRTPETVAQYKEMTKTQQGEVKDVGGFVGGRLNGDRRTSRNIDKRSLIVLDLDYATKDALGDIDLLCDFYWAAYSTHTHTPEKPRYRLLVPTDRPVAADEYEPVARWLAELVGIEQCDASTYDPARLMYWPSTSADGEFVYADGGLGPLNVDRVLASYPDWKNPIYWPTAEREARAEAKRMETAEDPRLKTRTIGAFCRCYPISVAMAEFLADEYELVTEGRYTYKAGSTAGGAKVYSDLWVYSHHGTDPCGGQLVNAFDLVRIHKFGVLDKDVASDTKVNRLPSYDAMLAWAVELDAVKCELAAEQAIEIELDFGGIDWANNLERRKDGKVKPTINNVAMIILNAPEFREKLGYNQLTDQIEITAALPWDNGKTRFPRSWTDTDDACLRNIVERQYEIRGKELVNDGLLVAITKRSFHPVRKYLDSLPAWDGISRIETLLYDYFGAEDTPAHRAMIRKTLIAGIARIMEPGIKFDQMLILHGPQGIGKSTLWRKLADPWFSDSIRTMEGKDAFEQIRGIWIGEMAELTATKKSEVEAQKAFLSSQVDRYRPAYGRRILEFPRQCILVGTTNEHEFLRDRTGNRRFWPVKLGIGGKLDVFKMTKETVEQVWAEAKTLYVRGEKLYLDRDLEDIINDLHESYTPESPWVGIIEDFLEKLVPKSWNRMTKIEKRDFLNGCSHQDEVLEPIQRVCAVELVELALKNQRPTKADFAETRRIMLRLPGWKENVKKQKCGPDYGAQRCIERQPPLAT